MTTASAPIANAAGQYQTGPSPLGSRSKPVAVLLVGDVPRNQPDRPARAHVAGPDGDTHDHGCTNVSTGTR
jgi:hypothetical protein